jgi:hypothetical protein
MPKSRNNPPTVLPDDADSLVVSFYISDGAPRVTFRFPEQNKSFDHAVSEYSSLTNTQKNNLRTMLLALRDETFTLEGYT